MKKYLKRLTLFSLPLLAYFLAVLIFDPFNFFNFNRNESKDKIAYEVDHVLWNCINFKNSPKQVIILGDSRVTGFSNECVNASENEFFNMGFNGTSLQEIIDIFWDITERVKLKEVYIGIGFHEYNSMQSLNRLNKACSSRDNFLSYSLNKSTFKTIAYYIQKKYFKSKQKIRKKHTKQWNKALNFIDRTYYQNYKYPEHYFIQLNKISQYCKKNKIRLVFFIPPNHRDVQKLVEKNNLLELQVRFKNDLKKMGEFYDFDIESEITKDQTKYEDPFHLDDKMYTNEMCSIISSH